MNNPPARRWGVIVFFLVWFVLGLIVVILLQGGAKYAPMGGVGLASEAQAENRAEDRPENIVPTWRQ